MDEDGEVGGDVFPPPVLMDGREVLWWVDVTQMRANAYRNFLNGLVGAVMGAPLGSAATALGVLVSGKPWLAALTTVCSVVFAVFARRLLL